MRKLITLLLLAIPVIAQAEYKINIYTGKYDYYKENVSTATKAGYATNAGTAAYATNADMVDGKHAWEIGGSTTPAVTTFSQLTDSNTVVVPNASTATYANNAGTLGGQTSSYFLPASTDFTQYATTTNVADTYLTKSSATITYLSKEQAAAQYLAITGKAADSNLLDGYDLNHFLSTGDALSLYLGINATAANSDKLDGFDSGAFLSTNTVIPSMSYWVDASTANFNNTYVIVTGTTSAAFQAAYNRLPQSGGTIELLNNTTYSWNQQINLFKNNVTVKGNGIGTVVLAQPWAQWATPGHLFYSSGTAGLTMTNMKIDGLAANTGQVKSLIYIQLSDYLTFTNLWLDYSDDKGLYVEGSNYVFNDHCTATNCDSYGLYYYGYDNIIGTYRGGYQTQITNNNIRNCYGGITSQYCQSPIISNNYIYGVAHWSIQADQVNYGITMTNNTCTTGAGGIFFYGTAANGFNCSLNSMKTLSGIGIQIQGDITGGTVGFNTMTNIGNHGIQFGDYNNVSGMNIIGNSITNAGNVTSNRASLYAYDLSNTLIAFNNCSNTVNTKSVWGFRIEKGSDNVISSNIFKNQSGYDIQVDTYCGRNSLLNNITLDPLKILNYSPTTILQTIRDGNFGFNVSSPIATVDIGGPVRVNGWTCNGNWTVGITTPTFLRTTIVDAAFDEWVSTGTSNAWDWKKR